MGTYMIPRNTKGEGRILFIFSTKALIFTVVGGLIGLPFYWLCNAIKMQYVGFGVVGILALIGFICGTFKIPDSPKFKVTRLVGGENIDDIVLRYIKFKRNKNRIYITKEEEIKNEQ